MYLTLVHFVRALTNTRAVIINVKRNMPVGFNCDMEAAISERERNYTILTKVSQHAF